MQVAVMNEGLFTAMSSDLKVTRTEVYGSRKGFPGGKASFAMALRRFLRSFGSILGNDLGTMVDVYESVDPPLGDGIFWLNLAATEGAGFVPGSSSNRLIRHRFDL